MKLDTLTKEERIFIVQTLDSVSFKIGQSNSMLLAEGIKNKLIDSLSIMEEQNSKFQNKQVESS